MSLASFITLHENDIIDEWVKFAQTCEPAAFKMSPALLRNHIRKLLRFIMEDLGTPQTEQQRSEKSKGRGLKAENDSEAETHGDIRFTEGFDVLQVHAEFRALRASVLKLWSNEWARSNTDWITPADVIPDLMRFNEAIDQMVSESLSRYINKSGFPRPYNSRSTETNPESAPN
jgi:hypothetical protein